MSKKTKKENGLTQLLPDETLQQNIIQYEFNLLNRPLFFVDKKSEGKMKEINIPIKTEAGVGHWIVSPTMKLGAGGPFEDMVLLILNKIINELPRPVSNPINIGSLRQILSLMDYGDDNGGWGYTRVKTAIRRMVHLAISHKFSFYDKKLGKYMTDADGEFHILDQCLFIGEPMPAGGVSEHNLIWMSSTLLKSINSRYVGPVDLDFYNNLRPLSRALFKILQVVFFAMKGEGFFAQFCYSTICARTTIKRQTIMSLAQRKLEDAHEELRVKGFLKTYRWEKIKGEKKDWKIKYWPGPLADKYSALHVPTKGITFLTNTDGETVPAVEPKQLIHTTPSLFDAIYSEPPETVVPVEGDTDIATSDLLNTQTSTLINFYLTEFSKHYTNKPLIDNKRDFAIIRDLLQHGYVMRDLRSLLRLFLMEKTNDYISNSGYTIPVFKTVLNSLLVKLDAKRKERAANKPLKKTDKTVGPWEEISKDDIKKARESI